MPAPLVGILAYPGVDELDLAGVYAVLRKAGEMPPAPPLRAVLLGPPGEVECSQGLRIHPHAPFADAAGCDALVLPGGRGAPEAAEDGACAAALRAHVAAGRPVYTVCSGAWLLEGAGVLPDGPVAVHHARAEAFTRRTGRPAARGMATSGWLCSVGGEPEGGYVKSVEMGFRVLADLCPEAVDYVAARLECAPRLAGAAAAR
ncbi:MAG TPA: DJ-1/PfpI family protein [Longimicrobium sp.]|nr:DJ-1/PfpI family protein [Longimicrobium sp.]